jgi:hypothetical protein
MTLSQSATASTHLDDNPLAVQLAIERPAPWMPLEGLVDLWAAYGKEASSTEEFQATSAAFAALAEEREAFRLNSALHSNRQRLGGSSSPDITLHLTSLHQEILAHLTEAVTHWFEAACALSTEAQMSPTTSQVTGQPPHDLEALIGSTLVQRERVWTISLALLTEQVLRYHNQEQGGGLQ